MNQDTLDALARGFWITISLIALAIFSWQSLDFTHQGFAILIHDKEPASGPGVEGLWWLACGVQALYAAVVVLLGSSPQRPLLWLFTALMAAMSMFGSITSLYHSLVGAEIAEIAEFKASVELERQAGRRAQFEASKELQRREWLDKIDEATRAYVAAVTNRFAETYDGLQMASRGHRDSSNYFFQDEERRRRKRKTANQYRLAAEQLRARWDNFTAAAKHINDVEGVERFTALRIAAQYVPSDFGLSPPVPDTAPRPLILDREWSPERDYRAERQSTVQALWTRATGAPDINVVLAVCCALIFELATVMCGWVNGLLFAHKPKLARLTSASRSSGLVERLRAHMVASWAPVPMPMSPGLKENVLEGLMLVKGDTLTKLLTPAPKGELKTTHHDKVTISYKFEDFKEDPLAWAVLVRLCDAHVAQMTSTHIEIKSTFGPSWLGLVAVMSQSKLAKETSESL